MEKKDYRLSSDFSDKVMANISSKIAVREKRKDVLIMISYILAAVLITVAIVYALTYFKIISNIFDGFSLPSFSLVPIFTAIKSHTLYLAVAINIIILYIIGESLSAARCIKKIQEII